jgi:hypothetical protein
MPDIEKIIAFLDSHLEKTGRFFLTAVEANKLLEQAGLLRDSPNRPGLPLRKLLRSGKIPHARQEPQRKYGRWYIPHSARESPQKGFRTMRTSQIYETTVIDRFSDLSAHFIVVPARSLPEGITLEPAELLSKLQAEGKSFLNASFALHLLAYVFTFESVEREMTFEDIDSFQQGPPEDIVLKPEHYFFAEYLLFARIIPFEQSPIDLESLGNLITTASGVGVGAYVGFLVGGSGPLLFVTVPAGMIICGAASGVAKALEKGLKDRILSLIRGAQ